MVVANRVIGRSDRFQRRLSSQEGRAMASRVNREVYARFCGRLEVKFLRPTRRATGVLRSLAPKPHPAFTGEVTIDRKTRPEGCRVKFRLKANAIKLYDHQNVLRIDINNPREFKVLRVIDQNGEKHPRWRPMGKSVEHFWRYAQVAEGANRRLIDALATALLTGEATQE